MPSTTQTSPGLWLLAWRRLQADRVAMLALTIVVAYLLLLLASATDIVASDWNKEIAVNYAPPTFIGTQKTMTGIEKTEEALAENPLDPLKEFIKELKVKSAAKTTEVAKRTSLPFGADKWGHDIIKKTIKGAETSIIVGLVAALLATFLGTLLGAFSGYFGGWIDDIFSWFYSIFTSIPYLLLILSVAAVLQQKGIGTIVLILALTGWTGTYRLIRAEYMKHKEREYVLAADAIGASHWRKMFAHIFPNVSHVALVQVSILVVSFIKSEVILSFLGFGVPVGMVSWGSMLNEAQNELILGKWWQLVAASVAMAVLVTAFSLFTDALRDALDPKLK
ncbi:ABC transporter permease [Solimicrobium silvestre]|uniref:Binding-protein-dependent transport system inner membrane component n=1 Tax=Solimicrobium silvestre TaxID=2099400 RepID=A0A2S9GTN5_9BURK|nr:ABC transporter permease [Solimicrobium silvestre]PRC91077.1 Binding-protein-dependent transport system inner membrane component [Solimicrobium silvestre]